MKIKIITLLFILVTHILCVEAAIVNGQCGENLTWSLNTKDSTLTIEGTGKMTWEGGSALVPWQNYCLYIAYISLPNGLTSIGNSAFSKCSNLKSIEIPNTVTILGIAAFWKCTGLTSVTIPSSITSIGMNAFNDCSGLTSITISSDITSIGEGAFSNCNINEIHTDDIASWCNKTWSPKNLSSNYDLYIEEEKIADLVIPNSVTNIGDNAFSNCISLTSVDFGNSITSIGDNAFSNCISLTFVNFGNSVTSIEDNAFFNCSGLTSIEIPDNITDIGNYAFWRCYGLTSVTIPNSITSIGYWVFRECTSLTSIDIPKGVTSIKDYAFFGCVNLTSVTIGEDVTSIGNLAFSDCNLSYVISKTITPATIKSSTFSNYSAILYVPETSIEEYQNALYWEEFTNIHSLQELPTSVENDVVNKTHFNKVIDNGQIHILRGDKTYTLQGQELK